MKFLQTLFKLCICMIILPYCILSAKKTKLCGNEDCTEKLFNGEFHRVVNIQHESFLLPVVGDVVDVYAIKISDRVDLMEGALERDPLKKGYFYIMHIKFDNYVDFLVSAIYSNKTMYVISNEPEDRPIPKVIGLKSAIPELLKDHKVYSYRLAEANNLPKPEEIDYAALGYNPDQNAGHGHSHDHGHHHSHADSQVTDHNSHENEKTGENPNEAPEINGQVVLNEIREHPDPSVQGQPPDSIAETESSPPLPIPALPITELPPEPQKHSVEPVSTQPIPTQSAVSSESNIPVSPPEGTAPQTGLPPSSDNVLPSAVPLPPSENVPPPAPPASPENVLPSSQPINLSTDASKAEAHVMREMPNIPSTHEKVVADISLSAHPDAIDITKIPLADAPLGMNQAIQENEAMQRIPLTVEAGQPEQHPDSQALSGDRPKVTVPTISTLHDNVDVDSQNTAVPPVTTPSAVNNLQFVVINDHPIDPIQNIVENATFAKVPESTTLAPEHETLQAPTPDIRTDIIEEDGLGYCIRGDCDKVYNKETENESPQVDYLYIIGKWLSREISLCRYLLPESANELDDAGVVVILFVPICVIIHCVRLFVFADSSDRESFDRRTLHNALTTIREREIQLKVLHDEVESSKKSRIADHSQKLENLQMEMGQKQLDLQQLRTKCRMMEEENEHLKESNHTNEDLFKKEQRKCNNLQEENKKLEKTNQLIGGQLAEMQAEMDVAREKSEQLEQEKNELKIKITRCESQMGKRSIESKKLEDQLKTSVAECRMLRDRVEMLQNETVQLSEIIEEMRGDNKSSLSKNRDKNARENGTGESGWSDFDEFENDSNIETDNTKTDRLSHQKAMDVMEVARLRAQLKSLEADLDQAKLVVQKERNEREHLIRKVELAESEAEKRLKEVDQKEAERIETRNEFKKILNMIEEKEAKIRSCEDLIDRLRAESAKWQAIVRDLEEQKKSIELKSNACILFEVEQELKKLKSEYGRLETRNFHEIRECRQTIASLQQTLEQSNSAKKLNENNLLNLSGTSSSDRELGGALSLPMVRPLWDDERHYSSCEPPIAHTASHFLSNNTSLDHVNPSKRASRTRRLNKDREHDFMNVDGAHTRPKKEIRRMRSRSQGRHPLNPDYALLKGVSNAFSDGYKYPLLNKPFSFSGSAQYSSGGSNEGRSPPPELALLSGIPPPGPMIKKPIVISRPKSTNEQMERRPS